MARQSSVRDEVEIGFPVREHLMFLLTSRSMGVAFLSRLKLFTTSTHPAPQEKHMSSGHEDTAAVSRLYFHPISPQDTHHGLPTTSCR